MSDCGMEVGCVIVRKERYFAAKLLDWPRGEDRARSHTTNSLEELGVMVEVTSLYAKQIGK
jgi:hypothetical protein